MPGSVRVVVVESHQAVVFVVAVVGAVVGGVQVRYDGDCRADVGGDPAWLELA